jgi:hypothetical protein
VDADIDPSVGTLDAARGLALLRLTQEALTNVAKHAGPTANARLRATVLAGDLHWEVTDDGGDIGPATQPVPPGGGHGLTGMRERVEVLGGTLAAAPTGAGGWRVATTLPAGGSRSDGSAAPAPDALRAAGSTSPAGPAGGVSSADLAGDAGGVVSSADLAGGVSSADLAGGAGAGAT